MAVLVSIFSLTPGLSSAYDASIRTSNLDGFSRLRGLGVGVPLSAEFRVGSP
jgi:hypothetical protein